MFKIKFTLLKFVFLSLILFCVSFIFVGFLFFREGLLEAYITLKYPQPVVLTYDEYMKKPHPSTWLILKNCKVDYSHGIIIKDSDADWNSAYNNDVYFQYYVPLQPKVKKTSVAIRVIKKINTDLPKKLIYQLNKLKMEGNQKKLDNYLKENKQALNSVETVEGIQAIGYIENNVSLRQTLKQKISVSLDPSFIILDENIDNRGAIQAFACLFAGLVFWLFAYCILAKFFKNATKKTRNMMQEVEESFGPKQKEID